MVIEPIRAPTANLVGVVEHGYVDDESTAPHEVNLVFAAEVDGVPVSQEDHPEFSWRPINQLSTTDLRPSALKGVLASGTQSFWHSWHS
ncbi:hypothetical protein [Nocardia sp. NPDC057440]|uniref:hypothetical protein n=1 Tax=Nocardia sp. NPDC057440 TaxID=3346134 RepID=UPI003670D7F0